MISNEETHKTIRNTKIHVIEAKKNFLTEVEPDIIKKWGNQKFYFLPLI